MWLANPGRGRVALQNKTPAEKLRLVRKEAKQSNPRGKTVDESGRRFETLSYDSWGETGMAGAADTAGVHSGVGGVSKRDYGNAHCDSRTRSDDAESSGFKCFRSEPDTAVARAGAARG